jgi:endonuclease/exonuclease/phosphatase family metal-dependent hydrolase
MLRTVGARVCLLLCVVLTYLPCLGQPALNEGDCVRLQAFSSLGVPLHPAPGNNGVSGRLGHATVARITDHDAPTDWFEITAGNSVGWIIRRYIDEPVPCEPAPGADALTYVVGSWNLEHFHEGASRGFPENTRGGPTFPARTQADYETIAALIETIEAKILVLEEIFAEEIVVDAETDVRSAELDRLISILGSANYDYVIGESGGSQHIAILYDQRAARLNEACETDFPRIQVQGKNLFDRQPLMAHFTLLENGQDRNDLVVVGVHLASGQQNNRNHDRAIEMLLDELDEARTEDWCVPGDENDILITGDFNASRFDVTHEDFWDEMESESWDVLADSSATYSPTRLAGVPLEPRSIIDYVIVSSGSRGLDGEEVDTDEATVHVDLVGQPEAFRRQASDHIPVTVQVRVMEDTDH